METVQTPVKVEPVKQEKPAMNDITANMNTYSSSVNGVIVSKTQTW